jgi:methyl-accepting chemotaxis protein
MKILKARVGARLGLGFAALLGLMLLLAGVGLVSLGEIGDTTHRLVTDVAAKVDAAHVVTETTRDNAARTMLLFLQADKNELQATRMRIERNKEIITTQIETLERLIVLPQGKLLLADVKQLRAAYVKAFSLASTLQSDGRRDEAMKALLTETLPALEALQAKLGELKQLQTEVQRQAAAESEHQIAQARWLTLALLAVGVLSGVGAAWWITRSITRPLNEALRATERIAEGDLGVEIEARSQDEVGQLVRSLQRMRDNLRRLVGNVRSSVDSVTTASSQIAAGNQDLSGRTESQASALQQSAASVEELAATVKQSAASAGQAQELATQTSDAVGLGAAKVSGVVSTMEEIAGASRRISEIIGVIDAIAFQTNILALNAAVEAARAGEQGRGFAVVASEVRALAQRSAQAAREIKEMITHSVEKVDAGSKLVRDAGGSMGEIVQQVQRVASLISEISTAARQQSAGLDQVNQAMSQMDQATQQNAALVEESAAAAESLAQQAQQLSAAVGVFRLDSGASAQSNARVSRHPIQQAHHDGDDRPTAVVGVWAAA